VVPEVEGALWSNPRIVESASLDSTNRRRYQAAITNLARPHFRVFRAA
jgi:hypothetical protein